MTTGGAFSANEGFLVAYSDGTNAYVAAIQSTAGTAAATALTANDLVASNIVQLAGVTSMGSFTAANFQWIG